MTSNKEFLDFIVDLDTSNRENDLLNKLTALWRQSVIKTHLFLTSKNIDEIAGFVFQALKAVKHLIVARDENEYFGFMGIKKQRLEMLFLAPQYIGQGIGHKLVEYAFEKYQVNEVTVNEQNPKAVGFYEHLGFKTYKRTDLDEQGRPFPLLYMRISK